MRWMVVGWLAWGLVACGASGGNGAADSASDDTTADTSADDTAVADVAADTEPADTTPRPPPPWQHVGPIVAASPVAPVAPYFVAVTDAVGFTAFYAAAGRAQVVDRDGDGRDDIAMLAVTVAAGEQLLPRFARNLGPDAAGQVRFTDVTADSGMADAEIINWVFADIDNDGDQDVFTALSSRTVNGKLGAWFNDGADHFVYMGATGLKPAILGSSNFVPIVKEAAALGLADFDGDGFLDLYIGNWFSASPGVDGQYLPPNDELYRGDGTGRWALYPLPAQTSPLTLEFEPTYVGVGRAAFGLAFADFDDDGRTRTAGPTTGWSCRWWPRPRATPPAPA